MPTSTYYAVLLALVLGVGCGKKEVGSKEAKSLNAEVTRQGLEEEIERLRVENDKLRVELAAAKKALPPQPKVNVARRALPKGVIRMDDNGRPTFSVLNLEAAADFYSGMHLDDIKKLYGNPFVFPGVSKNSPSASYTFHNKESYPENVYNPGTEKMEGRVRFYFHPKTMKCVGIAAVNKVHTTPYGKVVEWNIVHGPKK